MLECILPPTVRPEYMWLPQCNSGPSWQCSLNGEGFLSMLVSKFGLVVEMFLRVNSKYLLQFLFDLPLRTLIFFLKC